MSYNTNLALLARFPADKDGNLTVPGQLEVIGKVVGGGLRQILASDLVLYVSPAGNDSNTGTTSSAPLKTVQKAWQVLHSSYDLNGKNVTIQLADGTYNDPVVLEGSPLGQIGASNIVIKGNELTPANTIMSVPGSVDAFTIGAGARVTLQSFRITSTQFGSSLVVKNGGYVLVKGLDFAGVVTSPDVAAFHMKAMFGGVIEAASDYVISGGGFGHILAWQGGIVRINNAYINISNAAFGIASATDGTRVHGGFAVADSLGTVQMFSCAFSTVSIPGSKYYAERNGIIFSRDSSDAGVILPGTTPGNTGTGGQYL